MAGQGGGFSAGASGNTQLNNIDTRKTNLRTEKTTTNTRETIAEKLLREQLQSEQQNTSLLDSQSLEDLSGLVSGLSGINSDRLNTSNVFKQQNDLATLIKDRAVNAESSIKEDNASILSDSRLKSERQLEALTTKLAQQSGGSTANSYVTSAVGESRVSLESNLASLEAQLNQQARSTQLDESQKAIEALSAANDTQSSGFNSLSSMLNVLKGANVDSTKNLQGTETSQRDLSRILDTITNSRVEDIGRTKGHEVKRSESGSFGFGM